MKPAKANLEVFAETLLELAQRDKNILVLTTDSRGSAKLTRLGELLPDQLIEVGIAEQNLVGIAAGLASAGKKVFAVSPACFLTARAVEQIKNDVAYSDHPVKLVGISAGVSYGALGSTHHSLHDFAVLRAIHNVDIVTPADNFETQAAVRAAVCHPRPLYLRFGKRPMLDLHDPDSRFRVGEGITVREGTDLTFIAIGETVSPALSAATELETRGISCRLISMHTLRPLDEECLCKAACETRALITVEEHSVHGGLGEACAAVLMQRRLCLPFRVVGIPDEPTVTGSQLEILAHYGISAEGLVDIALRTLAS
jgi:transketolase